MFSKRRRTVADVHTLGKKTAPGHINMSNRDVKQELVPMNVETSLTRAANDIQSSQKKFAFNKQIVVRQDPDSIPSQLGVAVKDTLGPMMKGTVVGPLYDFAEENLSPITVRAQGSGPSKRIRQTVLELAGTGGVASLASYINQVDVKDPVVQKQLIEQGEMIAQLLSTTTTDQNMYIEDYQDAIVPYD